MRFWIAAAVLIGLIAVGLATAPRAIDWNAYRSDIEAAATELSGHDVAISGPIEIALLPRPVLKARDVSVTSGADEAVSFSLIANQADVTVEIGPLLAGRPVLRDLRLRRPVLTVDGDSSRKLRSWPPRWQDWAVLFSNLDLKQIGIIEGKIELADERPERGFSLSDISLELGNEGPDGPWEAAGLFKTRHHSFTLSAEVGRPDRTGVSAAKILINAQNGVEEQTQFRFSGGMTAFENDQGLSGRLTLAGPDLQHGLAAISAATGYPATFRTVAERQPFAVEGRIEADRSGVRTENLQLKLSEKLGKGQVDLELHPQTRLNLDVELPTLRLSDAVDLGEFLPLDLLSKLQVPPGQIDLRLREVAYRGGAARQARMTLKTGADGVTVVEQAKVELPGLIDVKYEGRLFAGEIGPRLKGRIVAVGDDLKSSLSWLGLAEDRARPDGWRSFSLESEVDVDSVEIALSAFDMRLDSSTIEGNASLRFGGRRRLALDVDVDRPNLDLYLAGLDAKAAASGLLTRLKTLDAEVDARFKRLNWQGVHVSEGSMAARAEQGRLSIERIAATTVGDTAASLAGEIDLDGETVDLDAELTSQHPLRALRHLKLDVPSTSGRLRPLALTGGMSGSLETFTLGLRASYDGGEAAIDGRAGWVGDRPWYDLEVNADHPDHLALAGQFGLAPLVVAGDAKGALELAGRLRHEKDAPWIASGSAKLGPTSFTGSLAYEAGALAGPFEAKISVGSPRKDSLAPFLILSGLRLAGQWAPARWLGRLPTTGLRTAWLQKTEGVLSLASKGGLVGDGLTVDAKLSDGLLYIERLEASPWQGKLKAEVTLERRRDNPFAAIAIDLEQIDGADFAAWLGVKKGIEGPLDLSIEASSVGRTPYDMMAGLAGEMRIKAGPGKIEGLGIPELRTMLTSGSKTGERPDRSLVIPFREIDTKAALSRGILTFEDGRLVLNGTPDGGPDSEKTALIEGTADLLLWIVDLTLTSASDGASDNAADPAQVYRVVGRPDRPAGFIAAGNR